jgi:hypothetical protein
MVKNKEKSDFENLLDLITGEKNLREKEERIQKEKKDRIKAEKDKRRRKVVEGEYKLEEDPVQNDKKVVQNIKLFEWSAPDRYQFKFDNKSFLIIVFLSLLFSLLLAILGNYLLMASIMAMLFLLYAAGTTKPVTVTHKITARGIDTGGKLYEWYMLNNFFFSQREDTTILVIESKLNFPKALILLVKKKDKDPLFVLLQEKLLYKDIRKWRWIDRVSYGDYIPLEEV